MVKRTVGVPTVVLGVGYADAWEADAALADAASVALVISKASG